MGGMRAFGSLRAGATLFRTGKTSSFGNFERRT